MAVEVKTINELLETIANAFLTAKNAFPHETDSFIPPKEGISLLDVKNDLLVSYLQHLVFLILLRLKNLSSSTEEEKGLGKDVVKKLIELRAYLDRGVRPLEGRLRYQIDKVLRAAEDAERNEARKTQNGATKKTRASRPLRNRDDSDISGSESDSDDGSDASEAEGTDEEEAAAAPNRALLSQAARAQATAAAAKQRQSSSRNGVYKPPRLNPVAMPESGSRSREDAEETRMARRRKNALLDEYINEEHSQAPTAQPSIGSNNTILDRGRQHTSLHTRDRDRERERTQYEESNFVRLPSASKAERKKDKARQIREGRDMFGGEDWTGLGGMGDRLGKSVDGKGRGRESALERREKRKRDTQDMPRGDGTAIGDSFDKRRKVMQGRDQKKGRR